MTVAKPIGRLLRVALLSTGLLLMGSLGPIPHASAAEYQAPGSRFVYELCDPQVLAGGNPPSITQIIGNYNDYSSFENCGEPGGAVGITQRQITKGNSPAAISVSVAATAGGFVESDTITAYAVNMQYGNQKSFVAVEYWPPFDGLEHFRTFPLRTTPPGGCGQCAVGGDFEIYISCHEGEICENKGQNIGARDIAATEVDPVPPSIGGIEGAFLSGATLRGHQLLTASATDIGGGLSVLEVLVDGTVAPGAVPGNCQVSRVRNPSYVGIASPSPSPCPSELRGAWNLNTAEAPFREGGNSVQVCASDFSTAGPPNTTCSPPQTVTVDDSCTASAVPGGQKLSAGFDGGSGEAVTVPFESPAHVTGELTTGSGTPVANATICVQTQVVGETATAQTVATATTDSNGTFTYELPPGPDRNLVFGYRDDSFLVTKTLSFGSRVKPSIELSEGRIKRGDTIDILGALPGPASAGRVVVLQASALHGKRWLTFRKATTGERGGFRAKYRFGGTSGTTTYRIRALVPRQTGYPWEPGHSVPKRVKVFAARRKKSSRDDGSQHSHIHSKARRRPRGGVDAPRGDAHRRSGSRR